jgi:hypothetical protein
VSFEWDLDEIAALLGEVRDELAEDKRLGHPVEDFALRRLDQAKSRLERISLDLSTGALKVAP